MPLASSLLARRHVVCGCCTTLAVSALSARTLAADEPVVVPVEIAPFHTVPTGNKFADVISARIPPGKVGSWHRHVRDFAQIWMGVSETETTVLGEKPVRFSSRKVGQTAFASYASKPLVHNVANVGETEFHVMGIQLKDFSPSEHMLEQRPKPYEVVIDNERLIGWRLTLEPGQAAPSIRQVGLVARFIVQSANVSEAYADGTSHEMYLKHAEFLWLEPAMSRTVANSGKTTLELVDFELK